MKIICFPSSPMRRLNDLRPSVYSDGEVEMTYDPTAVERMVDVATKARRENLCPAGYVLGMRAYVSALAYCIRATAGLDPNELCVSPVPAYEEKTFEFQGAKVFLDPTAENDHVAVLLGEGGLSLAGKPRPWK
jgi:hypothetical protein